MSKQCQAYKSSNQVDCHSISQSNHVVIELLEHPRISLVCPMENSQVVILGSFQLPSQVARDLNINFKTKTRCVTRTTIWILNSNVKVDILFLPNKRKTITTNRQFYLPRKVTMVTNCHIRAFSSIMARLFAILAQIVSAREGKKV